MCPETNKISVLADLFTDVFGSRSKITGRICFGGLFEREFEKDSEVM